MKIKVLEEISTGGEIIKENAIGEINDNRIIFKPDDVEGIPAGSIPMWESVTFLNKYQTKIEFISNNLKREILPFDQFIREGYEEAKRFKKSNLRRIECLRDYLTLLLNNPKNVGVVYENNPLEGEIGFDLIQKKEVAGEMADCADFFHFQYANKVLQETRVESYNQLKDYYDMAVRNKWIVERYCDPEKLKVGFIVRNFDGSIYYWTHISALKKKSTKN